MILGSDFGPVLEPSLGAFLFGIVNFGFGQRVQFWGRGKRMWGQFFRPASCTNCSTPCLILYRKTLGLRRFVCRNTFFSGPKNGARVEDMKPLPIQNNKIFNNSDILSRNNHGWLAGFNQRLYAKSNPCRTLAFFKLLGNETEL